MSKWNSLPTELLVNIFILLKVDKTIQTDLEQCSLTCLSWKRVAHYLRFTDLIALSDEHLDRLKDALYLYHSNNSPLRIESPGFYVKRLNGNVGSKGLKHLSRFFPYIESISLENPSDAFFTKLYRMISKEKFTYLKNIPLPCNFFQEVMYTLCVLELKDRLVYIELNHDVDTDLKKSFKTLYNRLDSFPKLKTLKVNLNSPEYAKPTLGLIDSLIPKNNNNLEALDFQLFADNSRPSSDEATLDIDKIRQHESIKSVKIESFDVFNGSNTNSYQYLMQKFTHLNDLYIHNYKDAFRQRNMKTPSADYTVLLLLYLCNIPQSYIGPIITDETTNEVLFQFYTLYHKNFITTTDYNNKLSIGYRRIVDDDFSEERTASLSFSHVTDKLNNSEIDIIYRDILDTQPPHINLLCDIGHYLHKLILVDVPVNMETFILEHIANHCTRLVHMELSSVSSLVLHHEVNSRALVLPNKFFKNLMIQECVLTQELFHHIAYRYPGIKNLSVNFCHSFADEEDFNDQELEQPKVHFLPMVMPTASFEVVSFNIDLGNSTFEDNYNELFIKLETSSGRILYANFYLTEDDSGEIWHVPNVENSNEEGYLDSVENEDCITYYIYCKSVAAVSLTAKPNIHLLIT